MQNKTNLPANARTSIKQVQPTDVITVLATSNPKQPGKLAHARFAMYKNGMQVQAYLAQVKAHTAKLQAANPKAKFINYGRADLQFDMHATRQYIVIAPPAK